MVSALGQLVIPSGVALALFAFGLLTRLWSRTRPLSWLLIAASCAVTTVFSSGKVAAALLSPLEYSSPALLAPGAHPEARHIVVLTGWAGDDPLMPLSGRMNSSSAFRVLMALELYADRPDCDVIVSGNAETARIMGSVLRKLGVPAERLKLEHESSSTSDSAAHLPSLVGDNPFFLVTSGGHMPRALEAMSRHGLHPIPAPTDHQLPRDWRRAETHPKPASMAASDLAVHEYVGRVWARLSGG